MECHTHMSYSVSYSCSDVLREKDALMVTYNNEQSKEGCNWYLTTDMMSFNHKTFRFVDLEKNVGVYGCTRIQSINLVKK